MKRNLWLHLSVALTIVLGLALSLRAYAETEAQRVVARLLAPPPIKPAPGFTAKLLVPPGELYDPLFMFQHDGAVWLTDDGGEAEGPNRRTGSRVVSVDEHGKVTVIVPYTKTTPMIAGNFAPPGFGNLAGQLIMFSQPKADFDGAFMNHVIQRLDPAKDYAPSVVCTLPSGGSLGKGVAGAGVDGRFGPPGSPFADRFFVATLLNGMVYQMNGAGDCTPFADFGKSGSPTGIAFSADGKKMLVSVQPPAEGGELSVEHVKAGAAMILSVSPDGKIDDQPFAKGFDAPMGLDLAPKGFGSYAGQFFVADVGPTMDVPVIMTQPEKPDGKVYRVTPDGKIELVASGFRNPLGVKFIGDKLWVTDVAGDFIGGKRELPDGFIVEISAK